MPIQRELILLIVIVTYVGVAVGAFPYLRMNRATIALVGAVALMIAGAVSFKEAAASLDPDTLVLLFAMMIVNIHLRLAGFFSSVASVVITVARSPRTLLACIIVASAVLSALFLNDTIVLMFTPLVLTVTTALKRNPIPYLIGLATAANIGSSATITGNPQNMLIGLASAIPYMQFAFSLAPVALMGLLIAWVVLVRIYRAEFSDPRFTGKFDLRSETYGPLLRKSLTLTGLMLVAFLLGAPIALSALCAASALLVTPPPEAFAYPGTGRLVNSGLFQRPVRGHRGAQRGRLRR